MGETFSLNHNTAKTPMISKTNTSQKHIKRGFVMLSATVFSSIIFMTNQAEKQINSKKKNDYKVFSDNTLRDVSYTRFDKMGNKQILNAIKGVQVSENVFEIDKPSLNTALKSGENISFHAKTACLDQKKKNLRAKGQVIFTSNKGYVISAPEALMDLEHYKVMGNQGVLAHSKTGTASAQTFTFDSQNKILYMRGNVVLNSVIQN